MEIKAIQMIETDSKLFENLIDRDEVMINHVVVPAGGGFDGHPTDSNVFIQVRHGEITLTFADGSSQRYGPGQLVEIPYRMFLKIDNLGTVPLELIVTKAPNPKTLVKA